MSSSVAARNTTLFALDEFVPTSNSAARDCAVNEVIEKPKRIRRKRVAVVTPHELAAKQLGESGFVRGHRIGWSTRKLEKGFAVARKGWALDERPKRLRLVLEGSGAHQWLVLYTEHGKKAFPELTWADVSECDWYLVEQLELAR